jgi:acetyltransferase-like isoleucine patch superfamily enzyme
MRRPVIRACTTLAVLLFPNLVTVRLLRWLGHPVDKSAYIGWSLLRVNHLAMSRSARIGHFNVISCRRVVLRERSYIQHLNFIRGPVSLWLKCEAAIGNRNHIKRSGAPVTYGPAMLKLGELTKITASHTLDCTRSIRFGRYSIVAGCGSQLWTHGYYHAADGPTRFRIDGRITVGDNVYIGSACVFSMGVQIANGITIGSHSSVSKSLEEPGLYVNQPLRFIPPDPNRTASKLRAVDDEHLCELVYEKELS